MKILEARSPPQAFSQRSLRYQFQLNPWRHRAVENMGVCGLGNEQMILANPPGFESAARPFSPLPALLLTIVVAGSLIDQRMNQIGGMVAPQKTGHKHCASIADIGDCRRDIWAYFVHGGILLWVPNVDSAFTGRPKWKNGRGLGGRKRRRCHRDQCGPGLAKLSLATVAS